mmetsp:Transcript_23068/g.47828  ORF Transcript_23068/g.47828 Transcript_23068/m.47828 type:complete len:587 (+) Transcript_23068:310-2070(+)
MCRKGSEVKSQLCAFDVLSNMGRIFPSQIRDFWLSSGSNDGFGIKELIRELLTGGKYGNNNVEGKGEKIRVAAVKLIESTLEGFSKNDGNAPEEGEINFVDSMRNVSLTNSPSRSKGKSILDRELALWIFECMNDGDISVRRAAAGAYVHMNLSEWSYLLQDSTTDHLEGILKRARRDGEENSGVRCNCVKAVSSMCARVLVCRGGLSEGGMDDGIVAKVIRDVTGALLEAGDDEDVNVKCMVMLAMGNLGQGIGNLVEDCGGGIQGIKQPPWEELCECVVGTLGEEDERVVASGIRAIGHLYSSYLKCRNNEEEESLRLKEVGRRSFYELNARILRALEIGQGGMKMVGLNSKQRYASNKHAWGACHSLGHIFSAGLNDPAAACVRTLASCVKDAKNGKVANAAMAALGKAVEGEGGGKRKLIAPYVGEVVLACLKKREDTERGEASRDLMWKFLRVATSEHLTNNIKDIIAVPGSMEFLYSFIVERSERESQVVTGRDDIEEVNVFSVLVAAMEVLDWDSDLSGVEVKVLQMFVSRSTLQERKIRKRFSPANSSRLKVQNAWSEVDGENLSRDIEEEEEEEEEL